MSTAKLYHVIQIILYMWPCEESLVSLACLLEKLSQPQFSKDLTRKNNLFQRWSWLKFNNLGLALDIALQFDAIVAKVSKLKVRKIFGLISTFLTPILNRVNSMNYVVNNMNFLEHILTQPAITCSKLTIELLEQGLKYVQS